ncbi:unnamed protein product [Gadus morhua 'NCC']
MCTAERASPICIRLLCCHHSSLPPPPPPPPRRHSFSHHSHQGSCSCHYGYRNKSEIRLITSAPLRTHAHDLAGWLLWAHGGR